MQTFSERNGFSIPDAEIKIRNDAPDDFRETLITICYKAGFKPSEVRTILCEAFFKAPDEVRIELFLQLVEGDIPFVERTIAVILCSRKPFVFNVFARLGGGCIEVLLSAALVLDMLLVQATSMFVRIYDQL